MDFLALAEQCAPAIDPQLMVRLVRRESAQNRFAIGLDGRASLRPQPRTFEDAVATAERLIRQGTKFSAGVAQIHIDNIRRFDLTWRQVFDPCTNLSYGQAIFLDFHRRAQASGLRGDDAVFATLRGYNSGNIHASVSNGYAAAILGRPSTLGKGAPTSPRSNAALAQEALQSADVFGY